MNSIPRLFVGIDVQVARGCAWAALDERGHAIDRGWTNAPSAGDTAGALASAIDGLERATRATAAIGIDAPRCALPLPRDHYWDRAHGAWRPRRPGDRGFGRHCEVVVSALGLGRPQWTPLIGACPSWMETGFALFSAFARADRVVHEVFPSAAYQQLRDAREPVVALPFAAFAPGPKDMLDAHVAALVVREVVQGRGCEVGGGDGLGTIALPRPVDAGSCAAVFAWPA